MIESFICILYTIKSILEFTNSLQKTIDENKNNIKNGMFSEIRCNIYYIIFID